MISSPRTSISKSSTLPGAGDLPVLLNLPCISTLPAFAPVPSPGSTSLALVFSPRQNVTFPAQLKCQMLCEAFPSIFSSVLTAPLQTPESVMKMMMISKLITANTVEHSLCARRCSKLFSCINAFNPHKDSRWWVLYHPHFVDGEGRPKEVKSSAQGCTAGE